MSHGNEMIYQQVTLSGYAEWPKVADAVIEAGKPLLPGKDFIVIPGIGEKHRKGDLFSDSKRIIF